MKSKFLKLTSIGLALVIGLAFAPANNGYFANAQAKDNASISAPKLNSSAKDAVICQKTLSNGNKKGFMLGFIPDASGKNVATLSSVVLDKSNKPVSQLTVANHKTSKSDTKWLKNSVKNLNKNKQTIKYFVSKGKSNKKRLAKIFDVSVAVINSIANQSMEFVVNPYI